MTTTGARAWACPHLGPEEWELIQRALLFAAKHANRNDETRFDLEVLHDVVDAIRCRNLQRRTAMRNATRRYRARQNGQRAEVLA